MINLTSREFQVWNGIARGLSNKEIARTMGMARNTVKVHITHLYRKLGVTSRPQAALAYVFPERIK